MTHLHEAMQEQQGVFITDDMKIVHQAQNDHEQWLYSILDRLDLARRDGYLTNDEFQAVEAEFGLEWRD